MSSEEKHIISVQELAIGYKSKKQVTTICDGITFSLREGELTAIVGANGIGKSTLLRTLAKVQPELGGQILLNQKELSQHKPLELASELSLVLTEQIPSKNLTVLELVALGRQPYTNWIGNLTDKDREKIKEALALIQIEDIQHKKCYELSDGQLQKAMIARALAQDTSLIILDEPTTHLDIYHKVYILKLLKRIAHQTRKTILFSSHEIDLAIQLCDNMLVMHEEGTSFGSPTDLIEGGVFRRLFPQDLIDFDNTTRSFKVSK